MSSDSEVIGLGRILLCPVPGCGNAFAYKKKVRGEMESMRCVTVGFATMGGNAFTKQVLDCFERAFDGGVDGRHD